MKLSRVLYSRLVVGTCLAVFAVLLGVGVGCSKAKEALNVETTSAYGAYSDVSGAKGTLSLEGVAGGGIYSQSAVAPTTAYNIAGELRLAGQAPINIAGNYDSDTGVIYFGSDAYSFYGNVLAGKALGASNGPNGNGTFVLFIGGTSANVATYCTSATCTAPTGCTATGEFSVAVSGSTALISAYYDGNIGAAAGSVKGSAVHFQIVDQPHNVDITIDGNISGSNVTGTWTDNSGNGYAGDWSGSTAACSAVTLRR